MTDDDIIRDQRKLFFADLKEYDFDHSIMTHVFTFWT